MFGRKIKIKTYVPEKPLSLGALAFFTASAISLTYLFDQITSEDDYSVPTSDHFTDTRYCNFFGQNFAQKRIAFILDRTFYSDALSNQNAQIISQSGRALALAEAWPESNDINNLTFTPDDNKYGITRMTSDIENKTCTITQNGQDSTYPLHSPDYY